MLAYSLKRIFSILPLCLTVVCLVSLIVHVVPGDPTDAILGEHALAADKLALAESLGLNKPSYVLLYDYLKNALTGDFGKSLTCPIDAITT